MPVHIYISYSILYLFTLKEIITDDEILAIFPTGLTKLKKPPFSASSDYSRTERVTLTPKQNPIIVVITD